MSVAKVIEISSTSQQSFEDAIRRGIQRASSSLRGVQSAWVKEQTVQIDNGQINGYRVNLMITFVMEDGDDVRSGS
jgi:flavin-binding protein dodecin